MTSVDSPSRSGELEDVSAVDDELAEGQLVGEYRVEGKIGEGGFGKVYRAIHPVIGKRAAIKVLNREYSANASVVSRFVSEARAVNQIQHRNIIDIFAFGTLEGGYQYFVMELLDGITLDAYLEQRGRLSPADAIPILRHIAKALDAAHENGIAHRDMKPENVFLTFDDEGAVFPKLLDFGIAKLMGDESVSHKTRTGAAMGTPLYMSPEQCHGKGVDHRTDIYSFGVMTHEMLTGRCPFDGESMMELMLKHVQEPPLPMSQVCPDLPATLDAPVQQMLAKDPAERPPSLIAAVEALASAVRSEGLEVQGASALSAPSHSAVSAHARTTPGDTPVLGQAATAMMQPAAPPTVAAPVPQAVTQQTMEAAVSAPAGGKSWLAVVGGLAVVAALALAFFFSGGPEPGETAVPAAEPPEEDIVAPTASAEEAPPPEASGTEEAAASASPPEPSAAPTARGVVPPVRVPAVGMPPVTPPPPPAAPPPPPPPESVPDDLEF